MDLYFPTEFPEQLAFLGAGFTALAGLFLFLLPSLALKVGGFSIGEVTSDGYAATRSTGGMYLGMGITALLLAQDWIYLALGAGLALSALGRLIAVFVDRGASARNVGFTLLQVAVAALLLGYVLGYF